MRPVQFSGGIADVAHRFGISVKALRVYEQIGLLIPPRTVKGWRVYGARERERLERILLLRALGLSLAKIGDLLDEGDLATVLEAQEQSLVDQRNSADAALSIVRYARSCIASGGEIDAERLAQLVQKTRAGRLRWTPELAELAGRTFDLEQVHRLRDHRASDLAAGTDLGWATVYAELALLTPTGDTMSSASQAMARRAVDLIGQMTGGDGGTWATLIAFWEAGLDDERTASDLPIDRNQWDFLSRAIDGLLTE